MLNIIRLVFSQPVDPFPDPTHAGQEIEFVGVMFAHIILLIFMILLMIYLFKKVKEVLPIIVVYMFSIIMCFVCLQDTYFPFTPYFQIFCMLIQSSFFLMSGIERYTIWNKNKNKR